MNSTQNSQFLFSRPDEEIPVVESYLHSKFRPIKPRPDFVNSLKNRLSDPAGVKPSRESAFYVLALIVLAVSSLLLILVGAIRVMSNLLENLRLFR